MSILLNGIIILVIILILLSISSYRKCKKLITNYFHYGSKDPLLKIKGLGNPKIRYIHTVSCFSLGLHLMEFLNIDTNESEGRPSFKYIWFLTCLYHDFGYKYENGCKKDLKIDDTIDEILQEFPIPKGLEYYDANTIKAYYKYRNNKEHGIAGAVCCYMMDLKITSIN